MGTVLGAVGWGVAGDAAQPALNPWPATPPDVYTVAETMIANTIWEWPAMRVLDRDTVEAIADYRVLVEALMSMYRTGVDVIDRTLLTQPAPDGEGTADCLI